MTEDTAVDPAPAPERSRRRLPAIIAAVLVVVALGALTAFRVTSSGGAAVVSGPYVGYRWRVVTIDDRQGHLAAPARDRETVIFPTGGREVIWDSAYDGGRAQIRPAAGGYRPGLGGASGWTATSSLSRRLSAALWAVAGHSTAAVRASVTGSTLTLHAGAVTLTAVRSGPAPSSGTATP